ncbi:hypothetical protein [Pseudomonas sp. UMAB-08]|uniref:hypothetical protein n=1 Tax=Pseudomonas sp. UMAB-08 TaxID=1365375 RepID=UPI001C584B00|nr:hypothetical protein [Pseudomonas sp. UMAB-08]
MSLVWFFRLSQKQCFMMWGLVDVAFIVFYCIYCLGLNRMPYVYDFEALQLMWRGSYPVSHWLYWAVRLLEAFMIFNLSVWVSCVLFFLNCKWVRFVVYAQLPFRLTGLLVLGASVFLIQSWMEQVLGSAVIVLLVLIEVFKVRNLRALNFQGEGIGAGAASDRER